MHHTIELIGSFTSATTMSGDEIKIATTRKSPVPVLCREMVRLGVDPQAIVKVTRGGRPVWKEDRTVVAWAGIDITESDTEGLRTVKHRPFPGVQLAR